MSLHCTDSRFKPLGSTFFVLGSEYVTATEQEPEENPAISGCSPAGSRTEMSERAPCLRRSYSFAGYVPYWLEAQHGSPEENEVFFEDPSLAWVLDASKNTPENTSVNISDGNIQIMSQDMSQNLSPSLSQDEPYGLHATLLDADTDIFAKPSTSFEWPDTDDEYESRVSYQRPSPLCSKSISVAHLPEAHDSRSGKFNRRADLHPQTCNSPEDREDNQFDNKRLQPGTINWLVDLNDGRDDRITETKSQTCTARIGGTCVPIGQPPANITCTTPSISTPGLLAMTIIGETTRPALEPSTPSSSALSPHGRSLRLADHVCFGNSERAEPHANS